VTADNLVERATRPHSQRRSLTPDQVERARELAAQGRSMRSIIVEIGARSRESLRRTLSEPVTALAAFWAGNQEGDYSIACERPSATLAEPTT